MLDFFVWLLFSYDDTATGLMGGEDEYLGNLDVGWGIGCIDGYIGDIVTRQWLDALIEFGGTIGIALKTDITEIRLYKAWLEVGDTYGGVSATSIRRPSERAFTAAFVAQYTLPPA